ncbi:MAG: hypothetical protein ABIJ56_21895, partial [Pseudomonadota bacterium]
NNVSGDGCSADCLSNETCGNNYVDWAVGEECDDGNRVPHDGCDENCRNEGCIVDIILGTLPLNITVSRLVTIAGSGDEETGCAGDGSGAEVVVRLTVAVADADLEVMIIQTGDHAFGLYTAGGDGAACTDDPYDCIDPGGNPSASRVYADIPMATYYIVAEAFNQASAADAWIFLTLRGALPECGDGNPDPGEVCDDGNTVSGDGCSGDCLSNETCGNNYLDSIIGEVCDDGNTVGGDGCSANCRSDETCGNTIVDTLAGEVCDDGNRRFGDGCSGDCLSDETCGNNYTDYAVGETCDDGNLIPGDGCDELCELELEPCHVDEEIGYLVPGEAVYRTIDIRARTDEWLMYCSGTVESRGKEYVLVFQTDQYFDIDFTWSQSGQHAFGLYTDTEVSETCEARGGWCFVLGPDESGWVTYVGWPPDTYYLIIEAKDNALAGVVDFMLNAHGCLSDENLGSLTTTPSTVNIDTSGGSSLYEPGCTGLSGRERVIRFRVDADRSTVVLSYSQTGDHVFGVFDDAGGECDEYQVTCYDPMGSPFGSTSFTRMSAGEYILIVDAHDPGTESPVTVSLSIAP